MFVAQADHGSQNCTMQTKKTNQNLQYPGLTIYVCNGGWQTPTKLLKV